jgi:hypothetical protein
LVLTAPVNVLDDYTYGNSDPGDAGSTYNMMTTFLRVGHDALNFGGAANNNWKGRVNMLEASLSTLNHGLVGGWYRDYTFMDPLQQQIMGGTDAVMGQGYRLAPTIWRPVFRTSDMPAADHNFIPKVAKGKTSSAVSSLATEGGAIGKCPTCSEQELRISSASEAVTTAVNFYIENMLDLAPEPDRIPEPGFNEWNSPDVSPEEGTNAPPPE